MCIWKKKNIETSNSNVFCITGSCHFCIATYSLYFVSILIDEYPLNYPVIRLELQYGMKERKLLCRRWTRYGEEEPNVTKRDKVDGTGELCKLPTATSVILHPEKQYFIAIK